MMTRIWLTIFSKCSKSEKTLKIRRPEILLALTGAAECAVFHLGGGPVPNQRAKFCFDFCFVSVPNK